MLPCLPAQRRARPVSPVQIYHTANCGLVLASHGAVLLVDALHGAPEGFSEVPTAFLSRLRTGAWKPTGLLFTHEHPDHYDPDLAREFGQGIPLITPTRRKNCPILDSGNQWFRYSIGGIEVLQIPNRHDGEVFRSVPHASLLITLEGRSVFIAGDAALEDAEELDWLWWRTKPQYGFFNIYQLLKPSVWAMISKNGMERVFLYHLPREEYDAYHYCELAHQSLRKKQNWTPRPELLTPMSLIPEEGETKHG